MRKLLPLILLVFIIPGSLFAQSIFKPGYIVGPKGDTTKGFIEYREWSYNPGSINFKQSSEDAQVKHLTTKDINYFELTDLEAYRLYEGPITMDDPSHVNESRDTSVKTGLFFLKVLQQGPHLALYSYTDKVKPRFFIQEKGGPIAELIYRSYLAADGANPNRGRSQVTENGYFRQLSAVADKYHLLDASMLAEIQHADYYKQNLLKIVSRINGISKIEYHKQYDEPAKVSLSASIALNVSSISASGNYKLEGGKPATSIFPAISVQAGIYTDPITQQLEFLVEGVLSGDQYQSIYIYTGSPYVPVKYSYHQLWFAVAPQVRYNFYSTQKLKLFAGLGIALNFHDYYDAKYDLNYAGTQVTGGNLSDFHILKNFTLPVVVKAGARIGGIEVFAAYFAGTAVASDYFFQLNSSNLQLGLSYIFK